MAASGGEVSTLLVQTVTLLPVFIRTKSKNASFNLINNELFRNDKSKLANFGLSRHDFTLFLFILVHLAVQKFQFFNLLVLPEEREIE